MSLIKDAQLLIIIKIYLVQMKAPLLLTLASFTTLALADTSRLPVAEGVGYIG